MYFGMLLFDIAVLAGTVYLIQVHEWSAWWMLLAVLICGGASPARFIAKAEGEKE